MTSLGQYLRTPRRLKRLVNSYSHLRSTLSEMDLHSLLRMDRPAYPAILAELALVIAAPVQASFLFEILAGGRPGTLTDLANDLDSNPEAETVGNRIAHAILEDYGRRRNDPGAVDELRVWQHRVQRYSFVSPAEPIA